MLTLQFGRAMIGQARRCQLVEGAISLFDVAEALRACGLFGVGVVVPDRTGEVERQCINGNLHTSWADLAVLRDQYGWSFVSNGQARRDLPGLSRDEQIVETCGSLDDFAVRGHSRAWGLFGPNSNQITDAIGIDVVNRCFAFTRRTGPASPGSAGWRRPTTSGWPWPGAVWAPTTLRRPSSSG